MAKKKKKKAKVTEADLLKEIQKRKEGKRKAVADAISNLLEKTGYKLVIEQKIVVKEK